MFGFNHQEKGKKKDIEKFNQPPMINFSFKLNVCFNGMKGKLGEVAVCSSKLNSTMVAKIFICCYEKS